MTMPIQDLRGAMSLAAFCRTYSLGMTRTYELIKEGKLRAYKCGKRTLILREDAGRR